MSHSLIHHYDAVLLDLDGTVYRGGQAVPGAIPAVSAARQQGIGVRFVTNNASRSPADVAAHLRGLGFDAGAKEVSTSAQAAAAVLAGKVEPSSAVMIVGTEALAAEVQAVGLRPVRTADGHAAAVVQGHSPETGWQDLAEACLAIRAGAFWVACNVDLTLPTERGELPGNGSMVAALRAATGQQPVVAGKPERPLIEQSVRATAASNALMVGDRLDTDIAGAVNAGLDALLVLTGVTTAADLLAAPAAARPRYVAAGLAGIAVPVEEVEVAQRPGWAVRVDPGRVVLRSTDAGQSTGAIGALHTLCAHWWRAGGGDDVKVLGEDDVARAALHELGLDATGQ